MIIWTVLNFDNFYCHFQIVLFINSFRSYFHSSWKFLSRCSNLPFKNVSFCWIFSHVNFLPKCFFFPYAFIFCIELIVKTFLSNIVPYKSSFCYNVFYFFKCILFWLFVCHFAIISLRKALTHVFFLYGWIVEQTEFFSFGKVTRLGEEKLRTSTNSTLSHPPPPVNGLIHS